MNAYTQANRWCEEALAPTVEANVAKLLWTVTEDSIFALRNSGMEGSGRLLYDSFGTPEFTVFADELKAGVKAAMAQGVASALAAMKRRLVIEYTRRAADGGVSRHAASDSDYEAFVALSDKSGPLNDAQTTLLLSMLGEFLEDVTPAEVIRP